MKKFKNPVYKMIHALKFFNWIQYTPLFQEKMNFLKLELKDIIKPLINVGLSEFEIKELLYLDELYNKLRSQGVKLKMKSVH